VASGAACGQLAEEHVGLAWPGGSEGRLEPFGVAFRGLHPLLEVRGPFSNARVTVQLGVEFPELQRLVLGVEFLALCRGLLAQLLRLDEGAKED
jgi:hypothetical protein